MESVKTWFTCVFAAIVYGIAHDQVTAHLCVEYFSMAHPTILPLTSATLLAIQWGVLATWWVGAILGVLLVVAARFGSRPRLSAAQLMRPILNLLITMACAVLLAGLLGFILAKRGVIDINGPLAGAIPTWKHPRFMADWWAHSASYAVGFFGGLVLCVQSYVKRGHSTSAK